MPAHIVKSVQAQLSVAYDDEIVAHEGERVIVAGLRNIVLMADDLPRSGENRIALGFQKIGVVP